MQVAQQYKPIHKPNQLIIGTGHTAIVTGWTVKKAIAKRLDSLEYAAIGQLYSPTRGINFLIRNLLANPQVRYLIGIEATKEDENAGGVQCLMDFFDCGVSEAITDTGKPCWKVNSEITGYIDREIPFEALELLRCNIESHICASTYAAIALTRNLADRNCQPWGQPQTFPLTESIPVTLPGNRYGHRIEGKTIAETWVKIIHRIKTTGTIRPTGYDGQWQELIDLVAIVTDEPPGFYFPDPNYLPCDREFIEKYIPQILDDAPYVEGVKYTYGQRLRSWFGKDQIDQIIQKLIGEIDAASAVMSLWDVQDHEKGGSPCLNHIWVRVVNNELSLTATFRSNDMFSAWPSNAMGLRALQVYIRDRVSEGLGIPLKLAPLITISQSAHIYDDCWENADKVITQQYSTGKQVYNDPVGNFIIERQDREIVVIQTTSTGEVAREYRSRSPLKLIREICQANPGIRPDHIGYLGIEAQKAHTNQNYIQDR